MSRTKPRHWLIAAVVMALAAPLIYAMSFGPVIFAFRHEWISVDTWMSLTINGPYSPLVRYILDGEGWLADVYRWWIGVFDP